LSNKTVLYIGGFELPDKNAAAQRVVGVGKLLRKIGFSVSYLGIYHSSIPEKELEKRFNCCVWSIKYPNSLIEWILYLTSIKKIKEIIKHELEEFPVAIIAYNYPSIALFRLRRFCKNRKIALIADCTEWSNYSETFLFRKAKSIDTFIRMRIIHRLLDGIIVISSFLFEYYNTKIKNIILLPPLVDKSDSKWNIKINHVKKDYVTLIYAGSPGGKQKDRLDLIITALSKTKTSSSFQIIIVGITKDQYIYKYGIDSLPLTIKENIFFMGRLSHIETIKLITISDYSILLRDKTKANNAGFPTKFVESITCGTPVLTNLSSNISDYFINGELGFLLDDKSEVSLIKSLKEAIDQPKNKIYLMKTNCLNYKKFHYETYESSFLVFIKNIMQNTHLYKTEKHLIK